jgi:hypothetical protein
LLWVLALVIIIIWIFSLYYSGYTRTIRIFQKPQGDEQARCIARDDDGYSIAIDIDDVCSWNDMSRFDIVNPDYGVAYLCLMGTGYDTAPKCFTNVGDKLRISDVTPASKGQMYKFVPVNTGGTTGFDQIRLLDDNGLDSNMCLSSTQTVGNELLTGIFTVQRGLSAGACPDDDKRDSSMEWYVSNAQWV